MGSEMCIRDSSLGTPRTIGREAVAFRRPAAGGFTMSLAEPVAYGRSTRSSKGAKASPSVGPSAHQKVSKTRDGYRVRVWIDRSWARGQRYPVVLDPTMVYSVGDETLTTAFGPTSYCETSPLSSALDGSMLISWWHEGICPHDGYDGDPLAGYVHPDLSNIPPWTTIDSAVLSLGWDAADGDSCPHLGGASLLVCWVRVIPGAT